MIRHDEPATMMHLVKPLLLLLGVLGLLLIAERAAGDTMRIHDLSGSDGPEIRLSQVAELNGDYVSQFADVVVGRFDDDQAEVEIQTSAILDAMRAKGAKLGLLDLSGFSHCTVRRTFSQPTNVESDQGEQAVTNIDSRTETTEPVTVQSPTTVQALIERSIHERLAGEGVDLQISFTDKDAELLRSSAVAGRYEVEPVNEPTLGKIQYKVYAYRGTQRVGSAQVVSAEVAQRVIAVIAGEAIERGTLINRRQVRLREVMVTDRHQTFVTDTALVVGQVASRAIKPGDLITAGEVQMPLAVHRRERVSVEMRVPGVKITFTGMARDQGSVGDSIEVENLETKEVFNAKIVGPGKVVAGEKVQDKKEDQP